MPDFRVVDETASEHTTIWHLLTHMSGWAGDLFEDTGSGDDAMAKYMALMADPEQFAPIGTVWSYNNAGFGLAGHLIEQVTGQRFEEVMKELVFGPLCLERCLFDLGDVITHRFAVGMSGKGQRLVCCVRGCCHGRVIRLAASYATSGNYYAMRVSRWGTVRLRVVMEASVPRYFSQRRWR
ncbi:MAG: beta-lactamase family protein [Anaerolineae bacterium]|nr:beta-lactamase family protein [Anaerolineae bacterium]